MTFQPHSIRWDQWIRDARRFHLTIRDVQSMNEDESVDLICFHRNTCDVVRGNGQRRQNKPMDPQKFFHNGGMYLKFTKYIGLLGMWEWRCGGGPRQGTFHLEYAPGRWYPLDKNETLPHLGCCYNSELATGKCVSDYPDNTRLGWRGPMMRISDLPKMPRVHEPSCLDTHWQLAPRARNVPALPVIPYDIPAAPFVNREGIGHSMVREFIRSRVDEKINRRIRQFESWRF